jgi:CheY-like chemotaxis protein
VAPGLGFEYFYGFIGGDSNQWDPLVVENTKRIGKPSGTKDYLHFADQPAGGCPGRSRRDTIMNRATQILIIDDEPNLRLMFRTSLESDGYRVTEASDGVQGLEQLRKSPADLVLLDLLMPGLGGMGVLQQLRNAGNHVPVVIITAHGSIPDAVSAMRLGAIDFLSKPVTPDVLRAVVAQVVGRHVGDRSGATPARSSPAPSRSIPTRQSRGTCSASSTRSSMNPGPRRKPTGLRCGSTRATSPPSSTS